MVRECRLFYGDFLQKHTGTFLATPEKLYYQKTRLVAKGLKNFGIINMCLIRSAPP